jgi:hypothetical protein
MDMREHPFNPPGRVDASEARQVDIHNDDLRAQRQHHVDSCAAIARLTHNSKFGILLEDLPERHT